MAGGEKCDLEFESQLRVSPTRSPRPEGQTPSPPHTVSTLPHTIMQVAKRELALECDYRWELASQQRFRSLGF